MLSTSAFNALLKTLEEPPETVYFVLATTDVHKIPNTVLSRCQRFDFRRIPTKTIAQHLQHICERDGMKFEPDALWTIARQGDGSMRDAQSLLDQTINFTNGNLTRALVVSVLGLTDRGLLMDMLAGIFQRDTTAVVKGLQRFHASGGEAKLFMLDLMEQVRNALLLKISDDRALIDLPDSEQEALLQHARALSAEDLHFLFDMCLKGAQDLARAADTLLVLEMVLLRMSHAPSVSSLSGISVAQASAPTPPAAAPTGSAENRYRELVEKIKEVNGLVGAQLENCYVVQLQQKQITLGVAQKHKFLFDKINHPDFKKKVGNYLTSFWGPGYVLTVVMGPETSSPAAEATTPKALSQKIDNDRQQAVRKSVEAHPLVQSAQAVFKAEIQSIQDTP